MTVLLETCELACTYLPSDQYDTVVRKTITARASSHDASRPRKLCRACQQPIWFEVLVKHQTLFLITRSKTPINCKCSTN